MRYTSGPWRIPVANVFRVVAPEAPNHSPHYPHAIVCDADIDNPDAAYNAQLIAASPRLAAALKELLDSIDSGDNDARLLTAKAEARAALREAGIE